MMNSFAKFTGDSFSGDFNNDLDDFFPEDLIISEAIFPGIDDFLIPTNEDWYSIYDNKFEHCFPENFGEYVKKKKLQYFDIQRDGLFLGRIFSTSGDEQHNQGSLHWGKIINKIKNLCNKDMIPHSCLIQLWRAVEIDCKVLLTTENQPFIISATESGNICEEHCSYQMEMSSKNYDIFGEKEEGEFVLRAFHGQLIEEKKHFLMESENMTESLLLGLVEIRLDKALDGNLCSGDLTKFLSHLQKGSLDYSSWSENVCEQVKSFAYIVGVRDDATPLIATNNDFNLQDCYRSFEECIINSSTLPQVMLEKPEENIVKFSDTNVRSPIEIFSETPRTNEAEMDTNSVDLLQTTHGYGRLTISKLELEKQFGKPLNEAAIAMGVSRSTVKRYCRMYGYKKWPRQRRNRVTVKAKYENNKYIEFKLYEFSGIDELHEQVAKRLKKSYTVHYPNIQDELILIGCDDDLQTHISSSKTSGNKYFNILLVHSDS